VAVDGAHADLGAARHVAEMGLAAASREDGASGFEDRLAVAPGVCPQRALG
jgi:hypothetical protein